MLSGVAGVLCAVYPGGVRREGKGGGEEGGGKGGGGGRGKEGGARKECINTCMY